ncbi:uncharacterized protein FPRN_06373 [Fusarium proliferatum]|nr:uncharacterized protein FPRN_06373 [Fusarium proliferatum]
MDTLAPDRLVPLDSSKDADLEWVASPDLAGPGVVLNFVLTAALSLLVAAGSYFHTYSGSSSSRLAGKHGSLQQMGVALLDQSAVTTTAIALSSLISWESSSAFTRKSCQLYVSMGNVSALMLIIGINPNSVGRHIVVALMALESFAISIRLTLSNESVSSELMWLERGNTCPPTGTDRINALKPLSEYLSLASDALCILLVLLLGLGTIAPLRRKMTRMIHFACFAHGLIRLVTNLFAIKQLFTNYRPYLQDDVSIWSFGQIIPLVGLAIPIWSLVESNIRGPLTAEDQDRSTQEDPSTSDTFDLFLSISPFVYFFRKIPLVVFIFSFIALSFGLIILSRWFQGNHSSVRHMRPTIVRASYLRNLIHYTTWGNTSHASHAPSSLLGLIPWRLQWNRESAVPPGYRRISWTCSCGHSLAANFSNSHPLALAALENKLHGLRNSNATDASHQSSTPSTSSIQDTHSAISIASGESRSQPSQRRKTQSNNNGRVSSRQNIRSLDNSERVGVPKFFELCVTVGKHSVRLGEINISSVTTDGQLFKKIWDSYREIKTSTLGATISGWFFKPSDVFFVHFGVMGRHRVGIYSKPMEIPPAKEVDEGRYHYFECPMQPLPPMPDHIFLHYLEEAKQKTGPQDNPAAHAEDIFLSRLPKKLGSSIFTSRSGLTSGITYGWGVHIVERPSGWAKSMLGILSALICIAVFAITWMCADFDKAIGIGQYITGVLAIINAAVYFALQDYSSPLSRRE